MRTAAGKVVGSGQAHGQMSVTGPLWDPNASYVSPQVVAYAGRTWRADLPTGRGQPPQGVGDGTPGDRDLLMSQRNGFAASVTGGYLGPTYTVTRSDDAVSAGLSVPGTLRYGLCGQANIDLGGNPWDPLWIIFAQSLASSGVIEILMSTYTGTVDGVPATPILPRPNKTIDGRGAATVKITFPDPGGSPVKGGFNIVGINSATNPILANRGPIIFKDVSGYNGVANLIFAYLTIHNDNVGVITSEVLETGFGDDLLWYHHLDVSGGADALMDMVIQYDYYLRFPELNAHIENALGRVTIDWCKVGPHPFAKAYLNTVNINAAPNQGASLVCDNISAAGKSCLWGLPDKDGYAPDNTRITAHHNRITASRFRNPEVGACRVHFYNNWVDHFGHQPGLVTQAAMGVAHDMEVAVAGGTSYGWSPALLATLDDARHKTWPYPVWDQDRVENPGYGTGPFVWWDGELLSENNIIQGFTTGEDHPLNDALVAAGFITSGQRWKVTDPGGESVRAPTSSGRGDPLMISRGELFEGNNPHYGGSAIEIGGVGYYPDHRNAPFGGIPPLFRGWTNGHYNTSTKHFVKNGGATWVQSGVDWGGVPPYDYVLLAADAPGLLKADLTHGSGNVKPWTAIS